MNLNKREKEYYPVGPFLRRYYHLYIYIYERYELYKYHIKWYNLYHNSFMWQVMSDKVMMIPLTTRHIKKWWHKYYSQALATWSWVRFPQTVPSSWFLFNIFTSFEIVCLPQKKKKKNYHIYSLIKKTKNKKF